MLTIKKILSKFSVVEFKGDDDTKIDKIVQLDDIRSVNELAWCSDKNIAKLDQVKAGTIICSALAKEKVLNPNCNYIIVDSPRFFFTSVLNEFFYKKIEPFISPKATIDPSVKLGKNSFIGHNVVIHAGCSIGDDVVIMDNTVIFDNSILGNNVKIGANTTIGGNGFGYEKDEHGNHVFVPHIGNAVLEDYVEIGNNNCVDRAVIGSTLVGKYVKTDNFVHIAHGVQIGENTLLMAHVMIAGSTKIGKYVWIGPGSSIMNKIEIKDDVYIGLGSVVTKSVEENHVVAGCPAKFLRFNKV